MFYFSFLSADTFYFWCISNSYMTRISLTSLWSLRGQWADPANDYIWASLYPVILYIYHYVYMCIYIYIYTQHMKKKKSVCKAQKISCPDWDLLWRLLWDKYIFYCSCSWKLVLEPKVNKVQEYFQFKSYQYKCWSCSGYHLLYFIYM